MIKKVLVVDDDPACRGLLKTIVESVFADAEIFCAENGEDGLRKFRAHHPCMVISDIQMPIMSGTTLFRKVRATSQAPFILVTGECSEDERVIAATATCVVAKPFNLRNFQRVLLESAKSIDRLN